MGSNKSRSERYADHVNSWKDCTLCPLCRTRRRTVFRRGRIPADILFIGEAPGPGEDSLGRPFVGPAGHVLDIILEKAIQGFHGQMGMDRSEPRPDPTYCLTNAVLCYPGRDEKGTIKAPGREAIKACNPRLVEFVKLVNPRFIVRLGNVAKSATKELIDDYPIRSMVHPSAIGCMEDPQMQYLQIERCVARLTSWMTELCK
jgi:uracil-DNA glycosylase